MSDLLALIDPRWGWLVAGVILAAAELVVPGIFLIWIAVAAILTGLVALLFEPPIAVDLAIFAVAAVASIYIGRNWYTRAGSEPADPLLNNRAARMIGTRVTICEAITAGQGRATNGDSFWSATGPDMAVGTIATVTATIPGAWD
jgi:membrane protein implicated in regulation of membrane protease activity